MRAYGQFDIFTYEDIRRGRYPEVDTSRVSRGRITEVEIRSGFMAGLYMTLNFGRLNVLYNIPEEYSKSFLEDFGIESKDRAQADLDVLVDREVLAFFDKGSGIKIHAIAPNSASNE